MNQRLFQVVDEFGSLVGLFNCSLTPEQNSDENIVAVLKDVKIAMDKDYGEDVDELLDINGMERVFVTEVIC